LIYFQIFQACNIMEQNKNEQKGGLIEVLITNRQPKNKYAHNGTKSFLEQNFLFHASVFSRDISRFVFALNA